MFRGLEGRRVLITGGASGIGAATARRFVKERSRVVVLDRDRDGCQAIQAAFAGLEGTICADVSVETEVHRAFEEMDRLCGGIDVLVNNAGISIRHRFLDITLEEWRQVLSVNLDGVFLMAREAAKRMSEQGSGVILNTASTNGIMGYPFYADYNASKAGVIELTRSMALELAPTVRVLAVCPGYVLTPMQEAEYSPEMLAEVNRKIPLGRHARPDEVAALFAFLASEEAPFLNGHPIIIDGAETTGGLASR